MTDNSCSPLQHLNSDAPPSRLTRLLARPAYSIPQSFFMHSFGGWTLLFGSRKRRLDARVPQCDDPSMGEFHKGWLLAFVVILIASGAATADEYGRPAPDRDDRYTYAATITRVIDGDTVVADIDLGFHTWRRDVYLRLARINAPEPRGPSREAGLASGAWLREKIEGKEIIIRTVKDKRGQDQLGSFRRYLVELFLDGKNLNDELVTLGLADYRE